MEERRLEIARGAMILGTVPESDIPELLESGFLQPTDSVRAHETSSWIPLVSLDFTKGSKAEFSLSSVVPVAKSVLSSALGAARSLHQIALGQKGQLNEAAANALESFTPQIGKIVTSLADTAPFRVIKSGVQNDDFMRFFGAAYDCLPRPVQRFVAEEVFVNFCMERREKFIAPADVSKPEGTAPN